MKKLAGILLLVTVISFYFAFNIFKVKNIEFSQSQNCITNDVEDFKQAKEKIIFNLKTTEIEENLKADYPCANRVAVNKKFPNTLQVNIETARPVAKTEIQNYVIYEDLSIKENKSATGIPTVFLNATSLDELNIKIREDDSKKVITLATLLSKSDFNAASIRIIEDGKIAVYAFDDTITIFSKEKDLKKQVDTLQQVLAESKIDATKIAKIDLSFNKPVILYK